MLSGFEQVAVIGSQNDCQDQHNLSQTTDLVWGAALKQL
jgi:hypothetical protein